MDLPDPTDRRDRLAAALLAIDPEMALLRWDAEAVIFIHVREERVVHLITTPPDLPQDRLEYIFSQHVKRVVAGSPPTHFIAVGGGREAAAALKAAAPFVQPVAMGFHHVDDAGAPTWITGKELAMLAPAAARVDMSAPLDPEPLAAALARGQQLVHEERAVAQKLGGQHAVTLGLVIACLGLAGLSYLWDGGLHSIALWRMGASSGDAVKQGEVYRLFASAFLHADLVHLLVNMLALWSFGPLLEAVLGPRRYLILYAASALGGAVASALLGSHAWSVGASGAIWGLMGAGLGLALRPKGILPASMAAQLRSRLWMPLLLNIAISLRPNIDIRAHFGGGLVGFALMATILTDGLLPVERRESPTDAEARKSPVALALAALSVLAMAGSVLWAIAAGKPWEISAPPVLERVALGDTGLTLEIPRALARDVRQAAEGDSKVITFGDVRLRQAPIVFEVVIARLDREVGPGEVDHFLEESRRALDEHAPKGWTREGAAKEAKLGERRSAVIEHSTPNGLRMKAHAFAVGSHEVLVRSVSWSKRPEAWLGIEERVAVSVK